MRIGSASEWMTSAVKGCEGDSRDPEDKWKGVFVGE